MGRRVRLEILRQTPGEGDSRIQSFFYETNSMTETVATALTAINGREPLPDTDGRAAGPIRWECNCLQKKCGACAMVINGRPGLACDAVLSSCGEVIRLEPLKKFPVVADLMVDRKLMYENLKTIRLWLSGEAAKAGKSVETVYDASRCLQCGCCLEVCPNFYPGGTFTGPASAVPVARVLPLLPLSGKKEAVRLYRRHVYGGCGKSLACQNVCPADIAIERMLVNSNAIAVWKSFFAFRERKQ